ncbi:hypothetical protein HRE53_17050 [Acaryochloris sp. 'Moss Beach']|uniref:hypothetical protein n=1 Tax=Acaryochloris marina TaxID=155978 RepID=UPI001BB080DC|nr:hypothetical protein [Acaryochloris marina]QUY43441.1 hypothetical protein I1H34_04690 [Acaryochloris marina S15]UJB68266.1 hypothetical protein HRE53_17050 [Acaryochloris sp. 'Moss Beach']
MIHQSRVRLNALANHGLPTLPRVGQCCQIGILSLLTLGLSPVQACTHAWQGKEYTELPDEFCQGYADALLGKQGRYEYGSVVCDRKDGSYFFLQRLVRYTKTQKAVWKIVQVKPLSKLHQDELALSQGCHQTDEDRQAIFAIVREDSQALTTTRAWAIDFSREALINLDPTTVTCQNSDPRFVP